MTAEDMVKLVQLEQANRKLMQIIENLKPTDLRDQFAMAAPDPTYSEVIDWLQASGDEQIQPPTYGQILEAKAALRYLYADAMLEARKEK